MPDGSKPVSCGLRFGFHVIIPFEVCNVGSQLILAETLIGLLAPLEHIDIEWLVIKILMLMTPFIDVLATLFHPKSVLPLDILWSNSSNVLFL